MNKTLTIFGRKLAELRQRRGLTLRDLAGKVGVSESYISRLESGSRQPSREIVIKVGQALFAHQPDQAVDELLVAAGYTPQDLRHLPRKRDLIAICQQTLEEQPQNFRAYTSLILALIRNRRYGEAQARIQEGFKHFDDSVELESLLSNLELSKENYEQALRFQLSALAHFELKPQKERFPGRQAELLLNLGVIYFMQGYQCIEQQLQALEQQDRTRADQATQAARESLALARIQFRRALDLAPADIYVQDEYARVCFNLAYLAEPREAPPLWQETIRGFQQVVWSDANQSLGHDNLLEASAFLAHAYSKAGRFDEARLAVHLLAANFPDCWLVHYIKACYYSLRYATDQRETYLDRAVQALAYAAGIPAPDNATREEALKDPDLKAVRHHRQSEFKRILEKEKVSV